MDGLWVFGTVSYRRVVTGARNWNNIPTVPTVLWPQQGKDSRNSRSERRQQKHLHPRRLTWNLRTHPWKRSIIFQTIIFRFYINLRGCNWAARTKQILWVQHAPLTQLYRFWLFWNKINPSVIWKYTLSGGANKNWTKLVETKKTLSKMEPCQKNGRCFGFSRGWLPPTTRGGHFAKTRGSSSSNDRGAATRSSFWDWKVNKNWSRQHFQHVTISMVGNTLPKFNIAPEKLPSQ